MRNFFLRSGITRALGFEAMNTQVEQPQRGLKPWPARPQRAAALLRKRDPTRFSRTAPTVGALGTGLESVYHNRIKLDKRKTLQCV